MNYYISDMHLFHSNVTHEGTNFDNRPYISLNDMHYSIKNNWNNMVTNADHVYILGDFSWKENEDTLQLVSTLKGNKHLIVGNHDKIKDARYKQLFVEIADYKELTDIVDGKSYHVVLFHYPIAFWNHQHHYSIKDGIADIKTVHLYGHLHATKEEQYYQEFINKLNNECNIKCIAKNVGCMHDYMNYTPQTLKTILSV